MSVAALLNGGNQEASVSLRGRLQQFDANCLSSAKTGRGRGQNDHLIAVTQDSRMGLNTLWGYAAYTNDKSRSESLGGSRNDGNGER